MGQGRHKEVIQPIDRVNPILNITIPAQTVIFDRSIYLSIMQ